jgi:hypothetical protein
LALASDALAAGVCTATLEGVDELLLFGRAAAVCVLAGAETATFDGVECLVCAYAGTANILLLKNAAKTHAWANAFGLLFMTFSHTHEPMLPVYEKIKNHAISNY